MLYAEVGLAAILKASDVRKEDGGALNIFRCLLMLPFSPK